MRRSGRGFVPLGRRFAISDPDRDSKDGHFRIRLDDQWIKVPDDAVNLSAAPHQRIPSADDLANALRALGAHVIGPVTELADAMSVEHDGFDVAVIDINLRGRSAFPVADEVMRVGKYFHDWLRCRDHPRPLPARAAMGETLRS